MSYRSKMRRSLAAALAPTMIIAGTGLSSAAAAEAGDPSPLRIVGAAPTVVLISLDGARPDRIQDYIRTGVLPPKKGLGALTRSGVVAMQNVPATPSLTAVNHIAIATGSTAVHNDIPSNSFHPVAAPIATGISGFAAPIGGYSIDPLGIDPTPTAVPLWVKLRRAGKRVVTATWPGADGADIRINNVLVQPADPIRITDYTVPFGAFGGLGATGFTLTRTDFVADLGVASQIAAAGRVSYSRVLTTRFPFETFSCSSTTAAACTGAPTLDLQFATRAAALDTTDDSRINYDTLVIFDAKQGIEARSFAPPATGPAYVGRRQTSQRFYFEGTGNKIGTAYFVSRLAPDLSIVRFARYSANYIPRNAPVLRFVDDINSNVGFWAPQPDFRIPERLSPGFERFPDRELEAIYEDQVQTFVRYQTRVAERAIVQSPGADLVMVYIEEPDGSGHQFTLTDPRQATDSTDPSSIGDNQDPAKVARYQSYVRFAYQQADRAVRRIRDLVGPESNLIVVSDHGMAPFHTAVSLTNLLTNAGVDTSQLAVRTSGAAANIYVNLSGREAGGTVSQASYKRTVNAIADVLRAAKDPNPVFNQDLKEGRIFTDVTKRPFKCAEGIGFCTSDEIGPDFGDLFVLLAEGYNFDGIQNPIVRRRRDQPADPATAVFSTPNFYGSHGHNSELPSMSASFLAAGPRIKRDVTVPRVNAIDVAPTIMRLLGEKPGPTVDGKVLTEILR